MGVAFSMQEEKKSVGNYKTSSGSLKGIYYFGDLT
jgi:hypothetical protein